jgi:WD40 repeat protein
VLQGHTRHVTGVCMPLEQHANRNLIASTSADRSVRLWDTRTWSCFATLVGHNGPIFGCSFWPGAAQVLASWSSDCTLRLWDTVVGGTLGSYDSAHYPLYHACFHQVDGQHTLMAMCGGRDALTGVPVYLHHCRLLGNRGNSENRYLHCRL